MLLRAYAAATDREITDVPVSSTTFMERFDSLSMVGGMSYRRGPDGEDYVEWYGCGKCHAQLHPIHHGDGYTGWGCPTHGVVYQVWDHGTLDLGIDP